MARFNRARYPDAQTIFLPAYGDMASVSSTHVRELLAAGGDIDALVPKGTAELMRRYYADISAQGAEKS